MTNLKNSVRNISIFLFAIALLTVNSMRVSAVQGEKQFELSEASADLNPIFIESSWSQYGNFCAIDRQGSIWCSGDNEFGDLGYSPEQIRLSEDLLKFPTDIKFQQVDTSCGVGIDNYVYCWGTNRKGRFGTGQSSDEISLTPVKIPGIDNAVEVANGPGFDCAVLSNGKVKCWGDSKEFWYLLGIERPVGPEAIVGPSEVKGVTDAKVILLYPDYESKILHKSGKVSSGTFFPQYLPNISDAKQITGSQDSGCALLADKTVTCWGQNGFGQLGRGNFVNGGPEKVLNLSNVKQVSMGDGHACALKEDNSIVCWGDNYAKQFQNSSLKYSNVPVPSYLIADVIRIIARNSITYFLTNSGRIIRTRTGLEIEDKTVDSLFNLRYTINSAVKGIGIKKAQGKVVISWRNSNSEFTTPTEFYWRIKKRNTSKWDKWKKSKEESPAKVILPLAKGKYDFQIRSNMNVFSLTSKVFKFRIL